MDKRIKKKRLAVILVYYYLFILNNINFRLRFDRYTDELFIEDTQDCNSPVRKKIKIIDGIKKDNTYKDLNDYSLIIIFDSKHNLFFDRQSNKLKGFSPEFFSIDNENGKEELSINFSEKKEIIILSKNENHFYTDESININREAYNEKDGMLNLLKAYFDDENNLSSIESIRPNKYEIFENFIIWLSKKMIDDFNTTFVLGTGVSKDYGAKSWNELVDDFKNIISSASNNSLEVIKQIGGANNSCSEMAKITNENKYYKVLKDSLYSCAPIIPKTGTTIETLINIVFRKKHKANFITYNFDSFLEKELNKRGFEHLYNVSFGDMPLIYKGKLSTIFHVHGFLPEYKANDSHNNSIVLTETDYYKTYQELSSWKVNQQINSFFSDVCFFIGNSLTDDYEKRMLDLSSNYKKFHFIFLSSNCRNNEKLILTNKDKFIIERYFFNYGVLVIWSDSFKQINDKLKEIFY